MEPGSSASSLSSEATGLRFVLRLGTLALAAFAITLSIGWLLVGDRLDGQSALVDATAAVLLGIAWRLAIVGRPVHAVTVVVLTSTGVAIALASILPPTLGLIVLPIIGATIALEFVSGPTLRRLVWLSWLASVAVASIMESWRITTGDWFTFGLEVSTTAVALAIAVALLFQFDARLRATVRRAVAAGEALAATEANHRRLVEELSEVVFQADSKGNWTLLNPAWTRMTGMPVEGSVGAPLWSTAHEEDAADLRVRVEELVSGVRELLLESYRLCAEPSEPPRWVEMRARAVADAQGAVVGLAGTLTDITERRRLEEQLTELAFRDPLTGLANRALFRDRVEHALALSRRSRRVSAVLFVDLDGFKAVNDSMGHAAGDRLLVSLASRFEACMRPSDTIARLGGDEFGILLENLHDDRDAIEVAERLAAASRQPVTVFGREIVGSASTGIAILDRRTTTVDEVLRNADVAMYEAKGRREGGFSIFEPAMATAAVSRMEVLSKLRNAVDRDELFLEYQPIVELATGAIEGVEALLRWRHPERGVVGPDDFIPIAEESGLIVPIGAWVLREACTQALAWQRANPGRPALSISVNVSAVQLAHRDLVTHVAAALDDTGIDPTHLVIELTETAVMTDPERSLERIRILKLLGVRIAIDDFGTGYSSLSYIRRLPVDIIKLDRSFISGVEGIASSAAMAEVFVRLGRALNIRTVAEGVEGPDEARLLRDLRCHLAQGFHFGRPSDPAAIQALLSAPLNGRGLEAERAELEDVAAHV